jgi:hypothetical protein
MKRATGATMVLLAVFLGASCARPAVAVATTPLSQPMSLTASNDTDLTISLVVNGQVVRVIAPHSGAGPIPETELSAAPWSVEARTVTGRVITSLTVSAADLAETMLPGGAVTHSIPMGRIDLACGRLTIWAGNHAPSGPVPVPGQGEPCVP